VIFYAKGVIEMPTISRFFGVAISMFYDDHIPPHFHAKYAEHRAKFSIDTLQVTEGYLPRRALALVLEWASLHRNELQANWQLARAGLPLEEIEPLD
jgi:hypothetical protein